jgi:hypothetical protein
LITVSPGCTWSPGDGDDGAMRRPARSIERLGAGGRGSAERHHADRVALAERLEHGFERRRAEAAVEQRNAFGTAAGDLDPASARTRHERNDRAALPLAAAVRSSRSAVVRSPAVPVR